MGKASDDCWHHPSFWTADDDSATEHQVTELVAGLVRGLQPNVCVETGCYMGQTTEAIGRALVANGHGVLFALDTDRDHINAAAQRCIGLPVNFLHTDSRGWTPRTPVNFAFIDSGEPSGRIKDIERLLPVVRPGTLLVVHDTGTQFGLRESLISWADDNGWSLLLLPTLRGLGLLRPPASWPLIV